jgi:hypothetical protein
MTYWLPTRTIRDHAPSSEDLAKVVMNLVHLKRVAKSITEVPFNVANAEYAQGLLQNIRVHPTGKPSDVRTLGPTTADPDLCIDLGWGGPYTEALRSMSPLPERETISIKNDL